MSKKIDNIREFVWKIIDTDLALKKDLSRGIINIRSLAKHIIETHKIKASLDSVISAIRRYEKTPTKTEDKVSVYEVIKKAKITTKTNMSSLLLKRTDLVKTKFGRPDKILDFQSHDVVRILEGSEALTMIFDRKNFEKIKAQFPKEVILEENKNVGMLEIGYPKTLKTTPGVFKTITSELAENDISIIDALISSNEHILVMNEDKLLKAFELIYSLCKE